MRRPAFGPSQGHARHYVVYGDGLESAAMPKRVAEDYAKMFGGTVRVDKSIPRYAPGRHPLRAALGAAAALLAAAAILAGALRAAGL